MAAAERAGAIKLVDERPRGPVKSAELSEGEWRRRAVNDSRLAGYRGPPSPSTPLPRTAALTLAMAEADEAMPARPEGRLAPRAGHGGAFVFARSPMEMELEARRPAPRLTANRADSRASGAPLQAPPRAECRRHEVTRPALHAAAGSGPSDLLSDRLGRLVLRAERQAKRRFEQRIERKLQA